MKFSIALVSLLTVLSASCTPTTDSILEKPAVACNYLSSLGLATGQWKHQYDNEYGCSTPYRELGVGNPMKNNLAYYVEGNSSSTSQLKLVLNVNSSPEREAAHLELLSAAETLANKALGAGLPSSIKNAILAANSTEAQAEKASLKVTRVDWPSGKGYEIKFLIQ